VLTLTVAPAVVLGLLGGLLADRVGPRRTMIVSSLGLVAISVILAAVA
jgi:nitrate/nitrite transporter NarK